MSLSDSQQQSLDQLLAITSSASDDDLARDVRILRETGWNVQVSPTILCSVSTSSSSDPLWPSPDQLLMFYIVNSQAAVEVIFSSAPTASSSSSAAARPPQHTSSRSGAPYSAFTVDDSHQGQPALPPNGPPPPSPGGLGARRTAGFRVPRGVRGISRVGLGVGWALYSIILWPVGVLWGLLGGGWGWISESWLLLACAWNVVGRAEAASEMSSSSPNGSPPCSPGASPIDPQSHPSRDHAHDPPTHIIIITLARTCDPDVCALARGAHQRPLAIDAR